MKRILMAVISSGLLIVAGVSVLRLSHPVRVKAQNGCSNASVQGSFGYSLSGYILGAAVAAIGRVSADGAGNASGADTVSANGVVVRRTFSGTYTVKDDCTGNATYQDSLGQVFHEDFVVMNNGTQIAVMLTDPGTVVSFVDVKQ